MLEKEYTILWIIRHTSKFVAIKRSWMTLRLHGLAFPPKTSRPPPEGTLLEHKLTGRIYGPVMSFTWPSQSFRQLDKTLVERQIMSHRIFPTLVRSPEERKPLLEKRIYFTERQSFGRRMLNSHNDQGDIRIRRLILPSATRLLISADDRFVIRFWDRICAIGLHMIRRVEVQRI